jgi:hypothetical protein
LGRGGITRVNEATGLSAQTIRRGLLELEQGAVLTVERSRARGGGRKSLTTVDPKLAMALERLVAPATRGDPMSPLRWTCKSTALLADELSADGHQVSARTVASLLHQLGYSLQANRKMLEGCKSPDRNAQFERINQKVMAFQKGGQPVISVDTKKKELVGQYKRNGSEWAPEGVPEQVKVHDFVDGELGKAIPYGVYDLSENKGWVSVGTDHDTPEFAVASIRQWWKRMGKRVYPAARKLLITADGGGSNGSRPRLWKVELQRMVDDLGLEVSVCHFPPGTSKWNKIEHRMFCHITQNWRGRPLTSLEVVVNLIAHTTTKQGLTINAALDSDEYPTGIKVTKEQMDSLNITRDDFHGEWNYSFKPREAMRA